MPAADVITDDDQLMSLKVMRLSRPSLSRSNEIYSEIEEVRGGLPFLPGLARKVDDGYKSDNFGLDSLLNGPSPSDTIYLGETFACYLCVNNESDDILKHMTLKVELQATYRHFNLVDTTITPQDINPHQSAQFIVHHEVKELGMHFLICSVHYLTSNQDRKFFKKIYKVNVLNPLAVKTKANHLSILGMEGIVLLEIQVQNLSTTTMYLENLKFDPNPVFLYQDLNFVFSSKYNNNNDNKSCIENLNINQQKADLLTDSKKITKEAKEIDLIKEQSSKNEKVLNDHEEMESLVNKIEELEFSSNIGSDLLKKDKQDDNINPWEFPLPDSPTFFENTFSDTVDSKSGDVKGNEKKVHEQSINDIESQLDPLNIENINHRMIENEISIDQEQYDDEKQNDESGFQTAESVTDSTLPSLPEHNDSLFGIYDYLRPNDLRQYLYKLIPKDPTNNVSYTTSELGKLDLVWRSSFGSPGRLQTSQLTRRAPRLEPITVKALSIPKKIELNKTFCIKFQIQNRTDQEQDLDILCDRVKMGSIFFVGKSPTIIGKIQGNQIEHIELQFLPMVPGAHKINGFRIYDKIGGIAIELTDLAEVFICYD